VASSDQHHINIPSAVAEFRAMAELCNQGRYSEAAPHRRRLLGMGLAVHYFPGRSKAARDAAAAEKLAVGS
jgi:hypothetical protein